MIQNRARKCTVISGVREPMPVERGESRSGERLIDWSVGLDPRIPACHCTGEFAQLCAELVVEEAGVPWSTTVMNEPDDRLDAEVPHSCQRPVTFRPVE